MDRVGVLIVSKCLSAAAVVDTLARSPNYATEFLGTFIYRISIPTAEVGYGAALSVMLLILSLAGAIAFGIRGMKRN